MTLAKLYRMTGYDRAATAAYKECLRFLHPLLHSFSSVANLLVLSILHLHVLNTCSPTAYFELYISIEMDVVVAGDLVWLYGLLAQLMRQIPSLIFFLKFFFPHLTFLRVGVVMMMDLGNVLMCWRQLLRWQS